MSLIRKQKMTEKNLAAKRRNGRKTRGPVSPRGKANSAAAMLRHGFYSKVREGAMVALGEDPKDYQRLFQSVLADLKPRGGLQCEMAARIVRVLWKMERAESMQDGLAVTRIRRGLEMEQLMAGPRFVEIHNTYEHLCALAGRINQPDPLPSPEEIEELVAAFGPDPEEKIEELFPLFRAFWVAAQKAPPTVGENGEKQTAFSAAELEREEAHKKFDAALDPVCRHYRLALDQVTEALEEARSPQNLAAMMAPKDENAVYMQRMEDSNLRQLWRLMRLYRMISRSSRDDGMDESTS